MALEEKMSDIIRMWNSESDPRTIQWIFVSSPIPMLLVTACYLAFVQFGPRWMAKREAFQLKSVLIVYNFSLVLLSAWMVKEFAISFVLRPRFNLICESVDYSDDPLSVRLAGAVWWYYFSKMIEYLETVFFILRKKNNQVSFLHVYHHISMPLLWYLGVRYLAGGSSYFSAMINCFVHVLMYGYYFLSALGPHMQPYLWWKRYLTSLQLIQFNLVMLHIGSAYFIDCGYPRPFMIALFSYCITLFLLFSNFFYHNYISKSKGKSKRVKHAENNGTTNDVATHDNNKKLTHSPNTNTTRRVSRKV